MIPYEEFRREVLRRKRGRWARILATEPGGRVPGRRPRDPEKEELLLRLDRARLARRRSEAWLSEIGLAPEQGAQTLDHGRNK